MASSFAVQSPADLVNLVLARIGYPLRVGNLYEGSKAAKKALDVYAQERDALLRDGEWPFAQGDVAGTLLKSAPVGGYLPPIVWSNQYPPLPWLFEYGYPNDGLKIRSVKPTPIFVPNYSPQPNLFSEANDSSVPGRVVLSDVPNAIIVYTRQVTNPNDWPVDFADALAERLGRVLGPVLANLDTTKLEAAEEQQSDAMAQAQQG